MDDFYVNKLPQSTNYTLMKEDYLAQYSVSGWNGNIEMDMVDAGGSLLFSNSQNAESLST